MPPPRAPQPCFHCDLAITEIFTLNVSLHQHFSAASWRRYHIHTGIIHTVPGSIWYHAITAAFYAFTRRGWLLILAFPHILCFSPFRAFRGLFCPQVLKAKRKTANVRSLKCIPRSDTAGMCRATAGMCRAVHMVKDA